MMLLALTIAMAPQEQAFRAFAKPLGGTEWSGAIEAPANLSWKCTIADQNEPGERIVVNGTIFKPDGRTPASGVLLYVYHTDSAGHYSRGTGRGTGPRHGKLRGWMLTGADGKYEFETIKPGPYPGRRDPAHIHPTLTAKDYPEHYLDEYLFLGDPLIPKSERDRARNMQLFNPILTMIKDPNGTWRATRDLKLQPPSRSNGGS